MDFTEQLTISCRSKEILMSEQSIKAISMLKLGDGAMKGAHR